MNRESLIVACIPAFNEEKTIGKVVLQAQRYVSKVVVCDDGSTDMTAEIAARLGADVVKHERNLGYGAAIQSLFKRAEELGADILVTLDADGQHSPQEIPNIVKPVLDDIADIAVGSRFIDERLSALMPWYRRAGVKFITKLTNGSSGYSSLKDGQSGFRAYDRKSYENLVVLENGMGAGAEILINARKQRLRICEVSSSCNYSSAVKTSTHNPVKHGIGVVMSIVKLVVEDRPLALLGIPGILCLVAGAFLGVWMLQIYATTHTIITNIALAAITFTIIGFFCLSTAITLFAISRLARKVNRNH